MGKWWEGPGLIVVVDGPMMGHSGEWEAFQSLWVWVMGQSELHY